MKFRCERDLLVEALTTVSRAVSSGRGGSLPVLTGVRLEVSGDQLHAASTDLDLTIQTKIKVSGLGDGVCVVPARLMTDIARSFEPGAVSVEGEDELHVNSGRSQFVVRTLSSSDFPRLPSVEGNGVTLQAADLADALRQVVRAAGSDDARPVLTGVLMAAEADGLRLVATDSYRLALRDIPGAKVLQEDQQVLVPSKALNELQRLLTEGTETTLYLSERDINFVLADTQITTRRIEGNFPNYRQLIPDGYPNRLYFGKDALLDAVRRVKLLIRDNTTPVRMTLKSDSVEISVVTQEIGQAVEEVDVKYEGSEMTVAFNANYLIDGIEAVVGDEVILETLDSSKPATLHSAEHREFLYLLMPVRVS